MFHTVAPQYWPPESQPLIEMALSPAQEACGLAKDSLLPGRCRACRYLFACAGECPKNRLLRMPEGEAGLNYLCRGVARYFAHIDPHIQRIVRQLGYDPGNKGIDCL